MEYNEKMDISQKRSYSVVKSNEIIQKAKYDLNIIELKTLAYIFSKIKPDDKELQEYTFSIIEYCQICGIDYDNGNNYANVKNTIKKLRDKSFWLTNEKGNEILIGWLQKAKISKGSGEITVKLDDDMHKYVIGMLNNYTQYELLSTLPMSSKYSFRIYELLKSYAFTKQHTFDIDNLKELLSATTYKRFPDFRRKVLEIAVKEINLYTDLEVDWEPICKGRKVIQVIFNIHKREPLERYHASKRAVTSLENNLSDNYYR